MSIDWPEKLKRDLARRRVIIVVGAGVSRHSVNSIDRRPPLWRDFLVDSIGRLPKGPDYKHITSAIDSGDFLHACEWIKKSYRDSWTGYLRNVFIDPVFPPAQIHQKLLDLDQRIVFTLNFDDIFERAASSLGTSAYIQKKYSDPDILEVLRGESRYIVKVHGSLSGLNDLVFTQGEYASARVKYAAFYDMFDAALKTHSFIFVGCGVSDPDISLLLENQAFSSSMGGEYPHYFLAAKNGLHSDLKKSLYDNRNLEVVEFEPFDENYSGLVCALEDLNLKVEIIREELLDTRNW